MTWKQLKAIVTNEYHCLLPEIQLQRCIELNPAYRLFVNSVNLENSLIQMYNKIVSIFFFIVLVVNSLHKPFLFYSWHLAQQCKIFTLIINSNMLNDKAYNILGLFTYIFFFSVRLTSLVSKLNYEL